MWEVSVDTVVGLECERPRIKGGGDCRMSKRKPGGEFKHNRVGEA